MSIIVSNCQHCDEQQFQTLSCVHYTIYSVVKSCSLLLDRILALEKNTPPVHLVNFLMLEQQYIHVLAQNDLNSMHGEITEIAQ